jgi:hypothetical protein
MKRISLLVTSLFFTIISFSQVTLTVINNAANAGDSNTYLKVPYFAPGDAGPDQVWDFSGINLTGEKMVSKFTSPSAEKDKQTADYSYILNEKGNSYFYKLNENSNTEIGGLTSDYTITYSDPIVRMMYPFAYGDHFTDDFVGAALVKNVKKVDFSGVYSVKADAFGTLIMPDHAYTDALRVRTESDGLEINQCNSVEVKVIHYVWYVPGHRYPVLNISTTDRRVSGREYQTTNMALVYTGTSGTSSNGKGQTQDITPSDDSPVVVVYPNPFGDKLNYFYFLRKAVPASVTLSDVTGRTSGILLKHQQQGEGLHTASINSDDLNLDPGIYYLTFVFDKQVIVKKVIKL